MTYTREEIDAAKNEIKRKVMIELGGQVGAALTSVEVDDIDAIKLLNEKADAEPRNRLDDAAEGIAGALGVEPESVGVRPRTETIEIRVEQAEKLLEMLGRGKR